MSFPVRWGGRHHPHRWDPFTTMEMLTNPARWMERQGVESADVWTPPADLEETDNEYLVHAELPGLSRDDISIDLDGRELEIRGETPEPERNGTVREHTRRVGRFNYRLRLPGSVDVDNVKAGLNGGILTVTLPKSTQTKGQRIEISEE